MIASVQNELLKLFKMKKLYVFFFILAAMTSITVYYFLHPEKGLMSVIESANAQSLPIVLKTSMTQFFGVFIAIYVTEIIANEYTTGTMKLSMLRPISRINLLHAKIASMVIFTMILFAFFILSSYLIGIVSFGWDQYFLFNGNTYSTMHGLMITMLAYTIGSLPYIAFGMLAVWVSELSKHMTTSIVITVGLLMGGQFLYEVPALKSYSIIIQMHMYHEYFVKTNNPTEALFIAMVCMVHMIIFYFLTRFAIKRKDILC